MRHRTGTMAMLGLWVFALAAAQPTNATAQDDAISVIEFLSEKDRWPRLVGAAFRIEGRYSVMGENSMRFRGCELDFVFGSDVRVLIGDSLTVEVRGRLARDDDQKIYFRVAEIKELPTDLQRLQTMRGGIDGTVAENWYELADWARERGTFYDDDDLLAEAAILSRNGITTEYDQLQSNDGEGLRALAEKVRGLGLSETLRMEFIHESLRRDYAVMRQLAEPNYAVVLGNMTRLLPGAGIQLDADVRDPVIEAYEADPLGHYRNADEATRRRCHRAFYIDLTKQIILGSARDDGSNGDSIAERFRSELPEFPELADQWALKHLEYELKHVARLTRGEAGQLSQAFTDRGDQARAEQVWRDWLAAREPSLRQDGVRGLMQLAGDYEEILEDDRNASRLVLEAFEREPLNHEIGDWLREHGYLFINGEWVLEVDVVDHPLHENERLVQQGLVRPGMSPEDVRRALGGGPTSIIRIASSRRVSELWLYSELHLSVRFAQYLNGGPATVDDVSQLR